MIKSGEISSRSRLRRVMATVVVAFLLLNAYFLTWSFFNSLNNAEQASLMRLAGIANTLALQIDGDAHQRLTDKYTLKDAVAFSNQDSSYLKIHETLKRNYTANMLKTPIYTIVLDSTNTCFFGVTSAEMPYFRHPYHSAPAQLMEKHLEGAMIPRYKDEFGTWLSAFSVVRNSKGDMVAWVQVDQDFNEFIQKARLAGLKNLLLSICVFFVFLTTLIRILQPILRKERQSKEALEAAYLENQRISEQIKSNLEQVKKLDDFRKEMIANLSHDLRTPMSGILGYLETIVQKKETLSGSEKEKYIGIALSESKRLNRLIADLFELSKLESGQIILSPEPFSIAELAQDTLQKYHLQAEVKHVTFKTDFAENLPLVMADLRWIDRVMQNLLDNALRYVDEGGNVVFTIFEESGKVNVKVCNTGDPISKEHLPHVFDRYFKSANRKKDSTGLGLTIVKKIMDLHGEKIWAEVNGTITTLRFTLPKYSF